MLPLTEPSVGCSVCYFLALPLKFGVRRDILWSNSPLGHEIKALACLKDTPVRRWSHPSCLRDANGWNSECPQLDHEQYGWVGVQLAGGYAGPASGMFDNDIWFFHYS